MSDQAAERTEIDASPEACFAVALDFERYTEWATDVKEVNIVAQDDNVVEGHLGQLNNGVLVQRHPELMLNVRGEANERD